MEPHPIFWLACALAPALLMGTLALWMQFTSRAPQRSAPSIEASYRAPAFRAVSLTALAASVLCLALGPRMPAWPGVLVTSSLSLGLAVLVQGLGAVIGAFSVRYLQGEAGQRRALAALAAALACVHLLLLADHWLLLILAWAGVGLALQPLLCFYPERPFARLAAHKKALADRFADLLLVAATALAWRTVGSGSLSALWQHVDQVGLSGSLQLSALCLVLAVTVRTALLPVHGWLIQVMEAPTPVSALLHAGVVNLGGFVLIRFAPLLSSALPVRSLLLMLGLATAVLAGMVTLTRVSIKVRLAWSTVAQMGFMLMGCTPWRRCTWWATRCTRHRPSCRLPPWCGTPACNSYVTVSCPAASACCWHR